VAAASGSTDADGDTVTYSYRWYKDDVHQSSYDDQTSVPSSATSKGEVLAEGAGDELLIAAALEL